MLEIADDLARFQGFLSTDEETEAGKLEGKFAGERRKFVYDAVREGKPLPVLLSSINADLDRLRATGNYYDYGICHVREELHEHITRQMGNSPFMRFAARWGPPALGVIGMAVYFYLKARAVV
jgi:hypothetical protein